MVEEESKAAAAAPEPEAAPVAAAKKVKVAKEQTVGKFTHGDHMVHILLQKGQKFISPCAEDR